MALESRSRKIRALVPFVSRLRVMTVNGIDLILWSVISLPYPADHMHASQRAVERPRARVHACLSVDHPRVTFM